MSDWCPLLNTNEYLVLGKVKAKVKIVKGEQVKQNPTYEVLIGYRDDVILGENIDYDDVKIYKKYNLESKFEDHEVSIYDGELVAPDFATNPDARRFITRITKACEKGINFAGHFTLVTWGCGSPCQNGVVVNRKTSTLYLLFI